MRQKDFLRRENDLQIGLHQRLLQHQSLGQN